MSKNLFVVVLAGGSGERLWPLSRKNKPKQLLPFINKSTLLEQTIDRFAGKVASERIYVVTTKAQESLIAQCVGNKVGKIIAEPEARNTAPAILFTCFEIARTNPDACVLFVPADHFIAQKDIFVTTVMQAVEYAQNNDDIVLLGIKPYAAAVGYGYIEHVGNDQVTKPVVRFHEKPTVEVAQEYIKNEHMLWNAGIFCAQVKTYMDAFRMHAPEIFEAIHNYCNGNGSYSNAASVAFDVAILEKTKKCVVVPSSFTWSDVGNVSSFLMLQQQYGNETNKVIAVNATANLIQTPKKLVALVGIDNVCVVETDDVLLIARRDQADAVKTIVRDLKDQKYEDYL